MKSVMKVILGLMVLLSTAGFTTAFTGPRLSTSSVSKSVASPTSLNMVFGKKKTAAQKAEEEEKAAMYWQGEWVCKDCGYIYIRVSFTQLNFILFFSNLFSEMSCLTF
jgi:hypothetical protein